MARKTDKLGVVDKLFVGLLLVIFGGIVLHAPLSVGLGTLFPSAELFIKSWKEILMGLAVVFAAVALTLRKRWAIVQSPLILLIALYAALHLVLVPVSSGGTNAVLAGLLIDLRYVLFFALVVITIQLYPSLRKAFVGTFAVGAAVVVGFALLQVTVLPVDVLKHIGYNETSIVPYLTVDENPDFIRINSTLRGPNPLGAFAVMVLTLLLAFGLRGHHRQFKRPVFFAGFLGIGGLVALYASYSRSALVAAIVAIVFMLFLTHGRKIAKWAWISLAIAVITITVGLYAARDTYFVSNVILHENATTGAQISSNDGHVSSLQNGTDRLVRQPLGAGIGSTGSASLLSDKPMIIENQYLFTAHETGWIGLVLFLMIFWRILRVLWQEREDWLAFGVLASGIGLALIGLLLPVWADDTVSIVWWGLAAVVIGGSYGRTLNKTSKRTA